MSADESGLPPYAGAAARRQGLVCTRGFGGYVALAGCFLVPIVAASRADAAPIAVIDGTTRHLSLSHNLDVLEDPSAALTIDDVKKPEHAARFVPCKEPFGPNYGFTRSAVWARFTVENASDAPLERWLVVDFVSIDYVSVFRDGEPPSVQGKRQPRATRELSRRTYSFRIALAPRQTRTIFVRAWGNAENQLPMDLWELGALAAHDRSVASWGALLCGVAFAMALYHVFLFFFVGDRVRLYYAGFVVSTLLWCACLDGALLDSLPQRIAMIPNRLNVIFFGAEFTFAWLFLRRLMELPGGHPRIDRALTALFCVGIGNFILYLVGVIDYRLTTLWGRPLAVAAALSWIAVAALRWRERLSVARYVVFAWSAYLLIAVLVLLGVNGIMPVRLSVMPQLASALEATLFSLALADASRQRQRQLARMHRESELLNQELRRQVSDRARQLADALARLESAERAPAAIEPLDADDSVLRAVAAAPPRRPPSRLATGDVVDGRYRVLRVLGRGGMGQVHEVERIADGRRLALKVLTGVADREALARFAREAQIAGQLDHPNIVSVLDVDVSRSGMLFFVMELVVGMSLAAARSRYGDERWAIPLLRQIAAALSAMHARGIVHRDLKPSNVLLDGDRVKVADFGIASLTNQTSVAHGQEVGGAGSSADSPALTRTGDIMGTPRYMAPELVRGAREAGPSADVFSLGVVAYELLSRELPFASPPVVERMIGHPVPLHRPLAQSRPELPAELLALVDRCLADAPDARPTAEAFIAALERMTL